MNRHVLNLVLLAAPLATAAEPTNAIQRLVLNPLAITRIPIATDRLTTVRFPSPVSDIESALVASEPHPDALFLLSFQSGQSFFSLRALVTGTNTTLNVVWKEQTYIFELVESRSPWLSVIFDPPPTASSGTTVRPVPTSRLLGLLDTAKAFGLLREQHPAAVAGVEVVRPNTVHDYGRYTINIEEVFRFEQEDTLVFRVGVSNKTEFPIRFLPESLMVRAGQRVFYQSITEASGLLPPMTTVPIYFAVTGSVDGSPKALSPRNDFMVLLSPLESVQPSQSANSAPAAQENFERLLNLLGSSSATNQPAAPLAWVPQDSNRNNQTNRRNASRTFLATIQPTNSFVENSNLAAPQSTSSRDPFAAGIVASASPPPREYSAAQPYFAPPPAPNPGSELRSHGLTSTAPSPSGNVAESPIQQQPYPTVVMSAPPRPYLNETNAAWPPIVPGQSPWLREKPGCWQRFRRWLHYMWY